MSRWPEGDSGLGLGDLVQAPQRAEAQDGACLKNYENMREFLAVWRDAKSANLVLPDMPNEHDRSLEHLLWHVLNSSGRYMTSMCAHLRLPDPHLEPVPATGDVEGQAEAYLERLLAWWRIPLAGVSDADMEPELYTPGMHYWIDAMLEHAVVHPARHSFQLRELMAAQDGEGL